MLLDMETGIEYLTREEAAARLGLTPGSFSSRVYEGKLRLRYYVIGGAKLYRLADVEAELNRRQGRGRF